jgi:hypothetical protein
MQSLYEYLRRMHSLCNVCTQQKVTTINWTTGLGGSSEGANNHHIEADAHRVIFRDQWDVANQTAIKLLPNV